MDRRATQEAVAQRCEAMRPHLDERQWRLFVAAEARAIGRGGIAIVERATGAARNVFPGTRDPAPRSFLGHARRGEGAVRAAGLLTAAPGAAAV